MIKKGLAVAVILLFIGMCVFPSTAVTELKDVSTVSFYGNTLFVGGSGANNYTTIQSAIDNASDGDTVFVYSGTYQEIVDIEKAIWLIGEDKNTTILNGQINNGTNIYIKSSDVTVREFTVNYARKNGFGQAIYIWSWNDTQPIENICVSDCILKYNDKGIFYRIVSNLSISYCHIHNNLDDAIIGGGSSNITVNNCIVNHNGEDLGGGWVSPGGIRFYRHDGGCSNVSVFDCIIHDVAGPGINVGHAENVEIYQNHIFRNSWDGVEFYSFEKPLINLELHHNSIYDNKRRGVLVSDIGIPGLQIHDNNISGNGKGNTHPFLAGIYIQRSPNAVTIQNNIISSNIEDGIYSGSEGTIIVGNHIMGNTERGVYIRNHANNSFIKDNYVIGNKEGLYVMASYTDISGNIISNNKCGITLGNSYNIFEKNDISNNDEGLYLKGGSGSRNNNIITCNNFLNNTRHAKFRYSNCLPKNTNNNINENYWNRARILPKLIFGKIRLTKDIFGKYRIIDIPWFTFDMNPASGPYDI